MKLKFDWFLVGMIVAVLLAWLLPGPGAHDGVLHPAILNKAGVALIFFLHGLALSFDALKAGTLRWRLHMVVQLCTFLLFPIVGLAIFFSCRGMLADDLRLGFFFLCALPSTVSSSVAMTATARGNVPSAVFNASLSGLLGVFLTPLWVGLVIQGSGESMPLGKVILDLVLLLLVPLAVGQVCRPWLGHFAHKHKKGIHVVDRGVILILIYTSFCDSMVNGVWSGQSIGVLLATMVGSGVLFFLVMWSVSLACDKLGFPVEDRITAIFCGSKKSLASGVPMAHIIFGAHPGLSLILLPILIYHPLQLVICGWLAGRWAARKD